MTDAVLNYLETTPTVGLRDVAKGLGVSRTTVHKAVRQLVAEGRLRVVRLGTCAEFPSTYAVTR